jgi:hypothetical protein
MALALDAGISRLESGISRLSATYGLLPGA